MLATQGALGVDRVGYVLALLAVDEGVVEATYRPTPVSVARARVAVLDRTLSVAPYLGAYGGLSAPLPYPYPVAPLEYDNDERNKDDATYAQNQDLSDGAHVLMMRQRGKSSKSSVLFFYGALHEVVHSSKK